MRSWFPGVNHRGGISQPKTVQILYHHHMLSLKGRVTMDLARKCPRKMPVPLIDTQAFHAIKLGQEQFKIQM